MDGNGIKILKYFMELRIKVVIMFFIYLHFILFHFRINQIKDVMCNIQIILYLAIIMFTFHILFYMFQHLL